MSWRANLRPAKLGKASFLVDSTAMPQMGRNVHVHEYPQRDKPYVEDLGRKTREFTLECYVLSTADNNHDYMPDRDALIAELETAGTKTLVHPYLGEMKVTVTDPTGPRESTREGGMARFTITCVESGERVFPSAATDTAAKATTKATAALQVEQTQFAKAYDVSSAADYVSSSAVELVQGWTTTLRDIVDRATTVPEQVTDFVSAVSELSDAASQLILVPQTLASKALELFAQITNIVSEPPAALDIVRSMFDYGDDLAVAPSTGASSRIQQATNQDAWTALIKHASLLTAVSTGAAMDFDSADDALALRNELLDVFDAQTDVAATDEQYYALVDARTAFVADMETRAAQLAKLLHVTLPESAIAIALAYDLYMDATRDTEIIARNTISDPNFLPSGIALEVLSNA